MPLLECNIIKTIQCLMLIYVPSGFTDAYRIHIYGICLDNKSYISKFCAEHVGWKLVSHGWCYTC